jgi:hypothetical protein
VTSQQPHFSRLGLLPPPVAEARRTTGGGRPAAAAGRATASSAAAGEGAACDRLRARTPRASAGPSAHPTVKVTLQVTT